MDNVNPSHATVKSPGKYDTPSNVGLDVIVGAVVIGALVGEAETQTSFPETSVGPP